MVSEGNKQNYVPYTCIFIRFLSAVVYHCE